MMGEWTEHTEQTITLPLDCEIFQITEMGAAHWMAMDGWTIEEAATLLAGANPKLISEFNKDPSISKPDYTSCGYVGILERLQRAEVVGVLSFPAKPSHVIAWAESKHYVPPHLSTLNASSLANSQIPSAQQSDSTAIDDSPLTTMPQVPPESQADASETQSQTPVPRHRAQDVEILNMLISLEYDPKKLPPYGPRKAGAKARVRDALGRRGLWTGPTVFKHAWERLSRNKEIKYEST